MTEILFDERTNDFRVLGGGYTYESHWSDRSYDYVGIYGLSVIIPRCLAELLK